MKKNIIRTAVSFILLITVILNFVGCGMKVSAENLMEGIEAREIKDTGSLKDPEKAADFAVRLFKAANEEDKNTLISPLSVLAALAMTANGAKENTLSEMESTLGMSVGELNNFFFNYMKALSGDKNNTLALANSIWFKNDQSFRVERDFLQTNADYYGADIYKAPFDKTTLDDINNWVNTKTDKMIPKLLDEIPGNAVMYLINALAFDAEWETPYNENQVNEGTFILENGETRKVDFMYGDESAYIDDGKATGFIKYYSGGKYAFAALLPNEGISLSDYINTLDGDSLYGMLSDPEYTSVKTSLPKFDTKYETELSKVLIGMGIKDAFDERKADFSGLGTSDDGNICISRVIHKTTVSVNEKGTKAGAATAVEMVTKGAMPAKSVYLDRPFIYMLIDTETNLPFFIGSITDING